MSKDSKSAVLGWLPARAVWGRFWENLLLNGDERAVAVCEEGDLESAGDKAVDAEETGSRSAEVVVTVAERDAEAGLEAGLTVTVEVGLGLGLFESSSESG